jgi:hypothetical protein
MKTRIILLSLFVLLMFGVRGQIHLLKDGVFVVNMTNNAQSDEIYRDAEPNIAVDPLNTNHIVATAFTFNPTGATDLAPIYISTDGGSTWSLSNVVPSADGRTHDIAVAFANQNHTLYTGILQTTATSMMTFRDPDPYSGATMTLLRDLSGTTRDQPYPEAVSRSEGGVFKDNVYFGFNFLDNTKSASVEKSNDARTAAPPAGFATSAIEVRNTCGQDAPPVRYSAHPNGVVYGAFVAWTSMTHNNGVVQSYRSDVVVVRDDNYGIGASAFTALKDPSDNKAGKFVIHNVTTNFCGSAYLGKQRGALGISISVNPSNAADVWIAWLDSASVTGKVKLHVRRSTNSGVSWSADLLGVNDAINPAVAVNSGGVCGVLYQKLVGSTWETHIQRSSNGTTWSDYILNTFDNGDANVPNSGNPIGDYTDLVAVGNTFYGVFSALNYPDKSKFPHGVKYLRNADFTTHKLRNTTNTGDVITSIDPFFFKISPIEFLNICKLHPEICIFKYIEKYVIHVPPYPCKNCPWPCINCAPFEIPIEEIVKVVFPDNSMKTILTVPYFHLTIEGLDLRNWEISMITEDGNIVRHEINKTETGYTISFRPSMQNFSAREGIHGLKLTMMPKNADVAKKGADFKYSLKASDYRFKEFTVRNR